MATSPPSTFAEALRRYRAAAGLTQEELAERARLSARAISDLERGINRRPHAYTIQRLIKGLELAGQERAAFETAAGQLKGAVTTYAPNGRETQPAHTLPEPLTPLLGREQEVASVCDLLRGARVRLVTLTGPGGVGKTRVGLQVAADLHDAFADGVFFVPLAPLRDPDLVVSAVAATLGVTEAHGGAMRDALLAYLKGRQVLLLLDNFEQVASAALLLVDLLASCPRLRVLVTSRAALHVRGEREFPVSPLALPDRHHIPDHHALSQYAGVALFVNRARDVKPDFEVTEANASVVAEICIRLDGLPLAIELAAARSKVLPPRALLARLERSIELLTGKAIDLPTRHQTLREAFAWSYDLLEADEQAVFRRLAVFVGGCTLEAAEAVCREPGTVAGDELDLLSSLVDKSLVRVDEAPDGEPRFGMLETVREYGLECLTTSGELQALRRQHAVYFLGLAETAEPQLAGPEQGAWLDRLELEHDNLRAVLSWSQTAEGDHELGLRLAGALCRFWEFHGHISEGWRWLQALLSGSEALGGRSVARAKALNGAGRVVHRLGDYAQAAALHEESLALKRELGDRQGMAASFHNLAVLAQDQGEYARAMSLYEESLVINRRLGNQQNTANGLHNMALVARDEGDYVRAASLLEESLAINRALGNRQGAANSLQDLGVIVRCRGDCGQAAALLEESLAISRALGDKLSIATSMHYLADVARDRGDYSKAKALYSESLAMLQVIGDRFYVSLCLESMALLASLQEQPQRAARLLGAADALRDAVGTPLSPSACASRARVVSAVRTALGDDRFVTERARGQALPLETVIHEAIAAPQTV